MASGGKQWIKTDESAKQMLSRIFTERPFLALPPPLHKLPLRAGNVVEIVGSSSSSKTHVLMQAAISCVLPKEWKGVEYGGMERMAAFVDLDCRFDILRFSHLLKNRIIATAITKDKRPHKDCDEELFAACMSRFLYVRCYDSFEFISTLKYWSFLLDGSCLVIVLRGIQQLFDEISFTFGRIYIKAATLNKESSPFSRKSISLQSVTEVVVQEIQKLLLMNPMLVLASKAVSIRDKSSRNEVMRNTEIKPSTYVSETSSRPLPLFDHMPSVWQSFVSHRIQLHTSDEFSGCNSNPIYSTEWLLPSIKLSVKFKITDEGVMLLS